ncbi:response regulator [Clostridiaceae bacterium HSG29]|nr:response regulator [Clostridiaceae bacterium HSG29]
MKKMDFYNTAYKDLYVGIVIVDKITNKIEYFNEYAKDALNINVPTRIESNINIIFKMNKINNYKLSEIIYKENIKIIYTFQNIIGKSPIIENCPLITLKYNKNNNECNFEYVSSNISKVIGYSYEFIINNKVKFIDIIHKNDLDRFLIEKENAIREDITEISFTPFRIITGDNKIIWVSDKMVIEKIDDSEIINYYHYIIDISKHIETENVLKAKESESKNIIEAANIGTWSWNAETNIVDRNDKWFNMLGYNKNEFEDASFNAIKKLCHPDDYYEAKSDFFKNFYSDNEFYEQEFRMKNKNGDWIWILDKGKIIEYSKEGEPKRIFGVHIDITKQKQIEERFRLFLDSADEIFMILDENLKIIEVNKAALNMVPDNIKKEFVIGKSFPEFYPYVNKNGIEQYYDVMRTGKPFNMVKKTINLKNEVRYIDISLFKMGKGVGYISRDITNNFIHQEKIKKMNENLSKILSNSTFGVVIVDKKRRIKWVNNATLKILGISNINQLKGKHCNDLLCTNNNGYCPILDGNEAVNNIECSLINLNNKEVEILKTATYFDYEGEEVILETFVDISERKKMERELKIESERLKFASKAKNEFLANMSHEIRTPLNGIIGFTDILMKTDLLPIQYDFMKTIKESGELLLDVITNILDFSKIEAGKMEFDISKTNLYDLVESAIDIVKFKAYEKKLTLLFNLDIKHHEIVYADSSKLKQVIINILGNAIKFTDKGYVILDVKYDVLKGIYNFSVKDTGIGIDDENQKKVLDSFSQADPTITRRFGGTGLGLSISSSILKLMGSELKIESEIDKGSNFNFDLNIKNEIANISKNFNKESAKTLIIENNTLIKNSIENKLKRIGVSADFAKNTISAFEMMKNYNYNYIIVDESIADDDFKLFEKMKRENFNCKIIILTKHLDTKIDTDNKNILTLLIPIKTNELLEVYKNCLEENNLITISSDIIGKYSYKILIAEDNVINMKLIKVILKKILNNVEIIEAVNGREAVEKFKNNDISLIFMDIQMPIVDGYNATRQIRKLNKDVNIIALTASSLMSEKTYCYDIGMNDYMQKPVTIELMKTVLKKWLNTENAE